jgi:SAM-dependent methyltransferase
LRTALIIPDANGTVKDKSLLAARRTGRYYCSQIGQEDEMAIQISEKEIRRNGPGKLLSVVWRQWLIERKLARRGIRFRSDDEGAVAGAYGAMSTAEFNASNGRQEWATWRTVPRALRGRVPNRPLRVLDLGCGNGSSTRPLAFYCPTGSHITGYELTEHLAQAARRRDYRHRSGQPARVEILCQSITDTLRQADGKPLPAGSVDLATSTGVIGHHLNRATVWPLVEELRRVLKSGGIAALDPGPTMRSALLTRLMTGAGFRRLARVRSWLLDPNGQIVFQWEG